jgi:Protein of unknown function (DUF4089)
MLFSYLGVDDKWRHASASFYAWFRNEMEEVMTDKPFDAAAYVDAMAAAVGIALDPAHRPGVIRYVHFLEGVHSRLADFPLSEALPPAPDFEP